MFTTKSPSAPALRLTLALAFGLLSPALPAAAQDDGSYGYFRTLEGSATLIEAESKNRTPVEVNQPVLTGDQVQVERSARLEAVLPDGTLVRMDGGTDLTFTRIAGSPDSDDTQTAITIVAGNVQLVVPESFEGEAPPRVDTPNATFHTLGEGSYRITSDEGDWSSLVVREGSAEAVTRRGSLLVRADEEAVVEGEGWSRAGVEAASSTDGLERWGERLDEEADAAEYVGEELAYEAAPLSRYGTWVDVDGSRYWRPARVDTGWRPFWHGRWVYTPSGLTWVAYEPWGWVTSHYGNWDYLPGFGWAWQPGHVYSPAWVYWYWGPRYVGWCPTGYYTRFYGRRHHGFGFHFGHHGWAGGDWGAFGDWAFVSHDHLGSRDVHRWARRGRDLGRERGGGPGLDRGLITTDTQPVDIGRYREPAERLRRLQERRGRGGNPEELPDVTPFIARKPDLPPQVMRVVTADGPGIQVIGRRDRDRTGPGAEAGNPGGDAGGEGGDAWRERGGRRGWQRPDGDGVAGEGPARPGRQRQGRADDGEPQERPRVVAPIARPRPDRREEPAARPRPEAGESDGDRESRQREERPRTESREREERQQQPRVETREREERQEQPRSETREREQVRERPRGRDRDSSEPPSGARRHDNPRENLAGSRAPGREPAADPSESWRRRTAETWRPAQRPDRREAGAERGQPGAGRRQVAERPPPRPERPSYRGAERESWRPRTVEPTRPAYTPPASRVAPRNRPERPAYTPPRASTAPRVSAPSRGPNRPAPSARPAAPERHRPQASPRRGGSDRPRDRGGRG